MQVRVQLFGGLTDIVGGSHIEIELPENSTVEDLLRTVAAKHPRLTPLLGSVNVAVDLEVVRASTPLTGTQEVALLPPVAGGSGDDDNLESNPEDADTNQDDANNDRDEIGDDEVDNDEVGDDESRDGPIIITGLREPPFAVEATIAQVTGPTVGGTAVFLGTVRDHAPDLDDVVALEYTAYAAMADRQLTKIADMVTADHPAVTGIALLHATGRLYVGDQTVLIVCSAAHAAEAFDACRDALARVKAQLPVWKREITGDGSARWVGLPPGVARGGNDA